MGYLKSLQGKILIFFIILDLTALSIMMFSVSRTAMKALEGEIRVHLSQMAADFSRAVNEDMTIKWRATQDLAANPFMINSVIDTLGRETYLAPFMRKLSLPGKEGDKADIFLLDYKGRIIAKNGAGTSNDVFENVRWRQKVMGGSPHAEISDDGKHHKVLFAFPIFYQSLPEGVLVAKFDVSLISAVMQTTEEFKTAIIGSSGHLLLGELDPSTLAKAAGGKLPKREARVFSEHDKLFAVFPLQGIEGFEGFGWRLVLSVPSSNILAPVEKLLWHMLLIGLLTATAVSCVVFFRTRRFVRPIKDLEATMQSIMEKDDLSQRVEISSDEEVEALGKTFNKMLDNLSNTRVSKQSLEQIVEERTHELKASSEELKTAQLHMLQNEKMASIGQLAAGVAHEINNPIGFVSSNLTTLNKYLSRMNEFIDLQEEKLSDVAPEHLEELELKRKTLKIDRIRKDAEQLIKESLEGTERVRDIVTDLKTFSRADAKEYLFADINECLDRTINIVWNEIKYKATVKKEFGVLPKVKCNLQQLNQVFLNLLVNAAQAIDTQGEITVATSHNGDQISVSIADTGVGIPEEIRHRIFEPFFTTKEVGKGTGLGLSISYDLIKKHNGGITLESELGRGTRFTITLPVLGKDHHGEEEGVQRETLTH
ncbi:sensor histidine kinase, HAMP domain-containing [Geotalea daltonii FRC-32]|uniref:histidine kinase n=1 Tax=Geotalea daltonii (strain DSM 22248 / JCM 15807 / FRC-32) TaxID=316067 RepID=B9M667_GEODF|nr:ATP-binding protein [Geotalea daltonii]ACM21855.1 sensor histidine kinase, HAMP domain-containing [Geotalea daltonii FRC-32]